jgi:hypothetical protein
VIESISEKGLLTLKFNKDILYIPEEIVQHMTEISIYNPSTEEVYEISW